MLLEDIRNKTKNNVSYKLNKKIKKVRYMELQVINLASN